MAPGDGAGGYWGWILVFPPGQPRFFTSSLRPAGSAVLCPGVGFGVGFPGAGLSQTQPVGKLSESRFKAGSTGGVSLWCCGCHEGVCGHAGGFLRHYRGVAGFVDGAITLYNGSKRPGRKKASRVELLPEPGSESRRIRVQRLGGERSPGSLTIRGVHSFSGSWTLGFQPRNFSPGRARVLRESNLITTREDY